MHYEKLNYNGKNYQIPVFTSEVEPVIINPNLKDSGKIVVPGKNESEIIRCLNRVYDYSEFKNARKPLSVGFIPEKERELFSKPESPRVLDMPIKFPGSEVRLPQELAQFASVIQTIIDTEYAINKVCFDEYYCYLTIDQRPVKKDTLHREAPCHVDGFQGTRWNPKVRNNHTYTVSDHLPTVYYQQPFDLDHLDPAKHDFFWEMNYIVAQSGSKFAVQPDNFEITLMDGYSVHRGVEAKENVFRTWLRASFEVRVFDRLGNAHNPHFYYDWSMVLRDIESLNLTAFHNQADPSLNVFPHQGVDGKDLAKGVDKTKPNLGQFDKNLKQ